MPPSMPAVPMQVAVRIFGLAIDPLRPSATQSLCANSSTASISSSSTPKNSSTAPKYSGSTHLRARAVCLGGSPC
eukprot:452178-Rhodomonas_salina.1